jgi:hypothetical protein
MRPLVDARATSGDAAMTNDALMMDDRRRQ